MLLAVRSAQPLTLLDLRHHARAFPVLQSLRYAETQELARDIVAAGFAGIIYRSAQQHDADCFAIFAPGLGAFRQVSKLDLVHSRSGAFHHALVNALRGSRLPVV